MARERSDLLLLYDRDGNSYALPLEVAAGFRLRLACGDLAPVAGETVAPTSQLRMRSTTWDRDAAYPAGDCHP